MHRILLPLILLSLLACSDDKPFNSSTTAFGKPLLLDIQNAPTSQAQAISEEIFADLHYISSAAHPWGPGALGRTNQLLKMMATFSANPSVLPLIAAATRLEQQSNGYYAPALGGLQQLWGFHSEMPEGPVPAAADIQALLAANPIMENVRVSGISIDNSNPAIRIDFGAMAQGYGLDVARQRLRDAGIPRARLSNGNIVAVVGTDWTVQLANGHTLQLQKDEALVTLVRDERAFAVEGKNFHPFLDPYSGYPSSGLRSVSVLHHNAADGAAFAQALLCGGKEKLATLLRVIPIKYVLAITDDGQVIVSDALKRRLSNVQP